MRPLKKGDTLEEKNGLGQCKILSVLEEGELYIRSSYNDHNSVSGFITHSEAEENYTLPEEPWKPRERGVRFYYVDSHIEVSVTEYNPDWPGDIWLVRIGNCYRTEAEAKAAAERVKKAYRGEGQYE